MNKSRDINKYINTVRENSDFFSRYYYHALIDLNLIKLDSILKYGILSKRLIEHYDLTSLYTHSSTSFDCKNGTDYISLTEYSTNCSFSMLFESFPLHTMTSLSILINKDITVKEEGENYFCFEDEVFCKDKIPKEAIEGLLLPDNLSNLSLNKVNCLPSDFHCYKRDYLNHWLSCVEEYFQMKIPKEYLERIKISHQQFSEIIYKYEHPERWVNSAIDMQKELYGEDLKDVLANLLAEFWSLEVGMTNPTYLDIIQILNTENIPIYELGQKSLKKISSRS